MKVSYEFVLLSLLVAFSWGSPLNAQPPKQSIRQVDLEEDSIPKKTISEDSGCYDQSPSCSYWALTGQCHTHPALLTSCCDWCNHMTNSEVVSYAAGSLCLHATSSLQTTKEFMTTQRTAACETSMFVLREILRFFHKHCSEDVSQKDTLRLTKTSEDLTGLLLVKNFNCVNKYSVHDCYRWAISDECYKNPAFMLEYCCLACRQQGVIVPW